MQMQQQQQVLIPTLQGQQHTQLLHIGPTTGSVASAAAGTGNTVVATAVHNTNNNTAASGNIHLQNSPVGNIYLSSGNSGNSIVSTDRNLGSTFRPNC